MNPAEIPREILGASVSRSCADHTPSWFVGHWRDWHRGHGCDQDDGSSRSDVAVTEIAQHAANAATGYLTDAELSFLRGSTTSGNTVLVRALDELAARRHAVHACSKIIEHARALERKMHGDTSVREIVILAEFVAAAVRAFESECHTPGQTK